MSQTAEAKPRERHWLAVMFGYRASLLPQAMAGEPLKFTIYGPPRPKASSGSFVPKGHTKPVHYTPEQTRVYQAMVTDAFIQANKGVWPHEGPVALLLEYVFPVPKSRPRYFHQAVEEGLVLHTSRPDLDNTEKAVVDGLNALAFVDDRQVAFVLKLKRYGRVPRVDVTILRLRALAKGRREAP